jgi:DNA-binding SARP family transcriptional activator
MIPSYRQITVKYQAEMGDLRFNLLGGLEILIEGQDVAPAIPKRAALLMAYLAMTGRPQSRQALADLLWGESPDASARLSLRTALWSLGDRFAPHLEAGRHELVLRPGSFQVDALEFARLAGRNRADPPGSAPAPGDPAPPPERRRDALQQAAALYRGDLLAGWAASRAPAFDDWLMAERQRLHDIALEAFYTLAAHQAREGAHQDAIDAIRRVLSLEPWHEEAHRQLMRLLALTGRRGEALMQYRACRRLLVLELGTEPTLETQAVYRELLRAGRQASPETRGH